MSYLLNIDKEKLNELKILAVREGTTIKHILETQIEEYIKVHKEGNPQHTIDKFSQNEDFLGFPSIAVDKIRKYEYIKKHCISETLNTEPALNDFGKELWSHITQWYHALKEY